MINRSSTETRLETTNLLPLRKAVTFDFLAPPEVNQTFTSSQFPALNTIANTIMDHPHQQMPITPPGKEDRDTTTVNEPGGELEREFVVLLCAALHKAGAPSHQTNWLCRCVGVAWGVQATYTFFVPVVLIMFNSASFAGAQSQMRQVEVNQFLDVAKAGRLTDLALDITSGALNVHQAVSRLKHITEHCYHYHFVWRLLAHTTIGFAGSIVFLKASFLEACLAGCGAMLMELGGRVLDRCGSLQKVSFFFLTFFDVFLACCAHYYLSLGSFCVWSVAFGGILWLIPGFGLTFAVSEFFHQQYLCGLTHSLIACVNFIQISFGLTLGAQLMGLSFEELTDGCQHENPAFPYAPLGIFWHCLLLPLCVLAFSVLCNNTPSQFLAPLLASSITFFFPLILEQFVPLGSDVRVFTSAFVLGMVCGVYSLFGRHPLTMVMPSVMCLVPGAMGVKGIVTAMSGKHVDGLSLSLHSLSVCLLLAVGLLLGRGTIPDFRKGKTTTVPL
eukprot:NODE_1119_length_1648_cov_106.176857_g1052_i0.p1 GENE.NODE_1119_length_1648_cov_106.176857_g1052_i0~~NODE_1119_length_1648_cov_106.176857_g1052_i0.p1  ORF type:complete len:501 (-),score=128.68 NODE_1119_length_1648_cov_106.176857_g1052_i0:92-1594(-)